MNKRQCLSLGITFLLAGCAVKAPVDQGCTPTISAGQSVTLTAGQRFKAQSGLVLTQPGGGKLTMNGHGNTINDHAGDILSVPPDATGAADNLVVVVATPPRVSPVLPLAVRSDLDHWQRFLKLIDRPDDTVTVDDFENAFGQNAVHKAWSVGTYQAQEYRIQGVGALDPDGDRLTRARYPNLPSYTVVFGFFDKKDFKTCIKSDRVLSDLKNAGWVLRSHQPGVVGDAREPPLLDAPYGSYYFTKGTQGVIQYLYSEPTACAETVIMGSSKLQFDRLSRDGNPWLATVDEGAR
ncbi:hypothetical protein [Dyella acidiphila]|uniref:Uncharacterized protein n=1 Tax=Dyella acidiphila TaxID=2775866 RepID=A0ABR9GG40_9GAMM|nr:hypothetical protein [Dyella acidiphila]MBE1163015.1 hypothetical protein [Dyella acidiphila]